MRLLYCGDVVGQAGRKVVSTYIAYLRKHLKIDFIVVNGENAAHGFGITSNICNQLFALKIDAITMGNHVWDQRETVNFIDQEKRLLRPLNVPSGTPGLGSYVYTAINKRKVLVVLIMGRLFMGTVNDPFAAIEEELRKYHLGHNVDAIILDMHAEATSEKQSMGVFLDGRVSMVVGSHTHVPSADARILPSGTAYQTDAGMCGDYDSVIGMEKTTALARFLRFTPAERLQPATGKGALCGLFVETDDITGLAIRAEPLRIGQGIIETIPEL